MIKITYSRCSTKKQDLESANKRLYEWAKDSDIHKHFQDMSVSGKKDKREGINKLNQYINTIDNPENCIIGVLEISRIGRSIGFIHKFIEDMSNKGIRIVLVNNNMQLDYKTLEGRALIGGLALAADIEWMLIKERNERGRQAIKERGIKLGRKRKNLSKEAIKLMDQKGMSLRQIAKELGVSAPTIMRFKKSYINGHLSNVTESNENLIQNDKIQSEM